MERARSRHGPTLVLIVAGRLDIITADRFRDARRLEAITRAGKGLDILAAYDRLEPDA